MASFITHKKGESLDDCQDAIKVNEEQSRYAIADGVTRSFFPKQWAELLVNHFCAMPDLPLNRETWKAWLVPIQERWYKQVEERVKARNKYYLTNSFNTKEPAVSTFIGLEVDETKRQWQAIVVGDSCLFHKSAAGFKGYLIEKSEDFTSHTKGFASFPEKNYDVPDFISGEIQSGDMFILATDALAKWILEHKESENLEEILNQLGQIENREQFNEFVDQARDDEKIRLVDDDIALILISLEESEEKNASETVTSEDVESRVSVLEVLFWGLGLFIFFIVFC